eukprot:PhM_4_TR6725/c0_g1_i1/m.68575
MLPATVADSWLSPPKQPPTHHHHQANASSDDGTTGATVTATSSANGLVVTGTTSPKGSGWVYKRGGYRWHERFVQITPMLLTYSEYEITTASPSSNKKAFVVHPWRYRAEPLPSKSDGTGTSARFPLCLHLGGQHFGRIVVAFPTAAQRANFIETMRSVMTQPQRPPLEVSSPRHHADCVFEGEVLRRCSDAISSWAWKCIRLWRTVLVLSDDSIGADSADAATKGMRMLPLEGMELVLCNPINGTIFPVAVRPKQNEGKCNNKTTFLAADSAPVRDAWWWLLSSAVADANGGASLRRSPKMVDFCRDKAGSVLRYVRARPKGSRSSVLVLPLDEVEPHNANVLGDRGVCNGNVGATAPTFIVSSLSGSTGKSNNEDKQQPTASVSVNPIPAHWVPNPSISEMLSSPCSREDASSESANSCPDESGGVIQAVVSCGLVLPPRPACITVSAEDRELKVCDVDDYKGTDAHSSGAEILRVPLDSIVRVSSADPDTDSACAAPPAIMTIECSTYPHPLVVRLPCRDHHQRLRNLILGVSSCALPAPTYDNEEETGNGSPACDHDENPTAAAVGTSEIVEVLKKNKWEGAWHKRWVCVADAVLVTYKTHDEHHSTTDNGAKMLPLHHAGTEVELLVYNIENKDDGHDVPFVFRVVTPSDETYLGFVDVDTFNYIYYYAMSSVYGVAHCI